MRIYRCISAREIMSKYTDIEIIPQYSTRENTHYYESGKKYIHFFRYKEFAQYFLKTNQETAIDPLNRYVLFMTANIPNEILQQYREYGFYGYKEMNFTETTIPIPEYAIPIEKMKQEYIVAINDKIGMGLGSKEGEFAKYLILIQKLLDKYKNNYHQIATFLLQNNLVELLDVKDDDRTEEQLRIDTEKLVNEFIQERNEDNIVKDDEIETYTRKK